MDAALLASLLGVGLIAGFLAALFGIGGGIVMVPIMHYILGVPFHQATANSLMAIALMTPWAVLQHARRHTVNWRIGGWMALGGAFGVVVGIQLEPYVPVPWLKVGFAVVMLLAAYRMATGPAHVRFHTQHPVMIVSLGLVAGIASKLLGIGGGLITVPALTFAGTAIHVAVSSSLVPVFTNAAFASAAKLAEASNLWYGVPLALGGLAGIPLGAWSAHALPAASLKRVFAVALVGAALYVGPTSGAF